MPFEKRIPHPLSENGARCYAPAAPGVYGLSTSREWVYIGQADDIQAALLGHLRDEAILKWGPTGFVFEACSGDQRRIRQDCLILEYAPICNRGLSRRRASSSR